MNPLPKSPQMLDALAEAVFSGQYICDIVSSSFRWEEHGGTMIEREIMEQIKKLTPAERLTVVEKTLRSIREDLEQIEKPASETDLNRKLAKAAEALLADYESKGDFTAFTALDGEDFHAS